MSVDTANIENQVIDIIVEHLGVEEASKVQPSAHIANDLGADSLDVVELVMGLEEKFDIEIPDEDAEKIQTVQDIIEYIKQKVGQRNGS